MTTLTARFRRLRSDRILHTPHGSHSAPTGRPARPGRARDALAASASGGVLVSRPTSFR